MKKNKKLKFVIVSYRQHHGGPIVLHVLCKQLQNMGYDASVFYYAGGNYRKGHKLKFWLNYLFFLLKDTIKLLAVKIVGENRLLTVPVFNGHVNVAIKGCNRHYFPFVGNDTIVVYPEDVYGNFMHAKKVVRWFLYYPNYIDGDYDKNDLFICYRTEFNDRGLNPNEIVLQCQYYNLDLYHRFNYGPRKGLCYIIRKGKNRNDLPEKFDGVIVDSLSEIDKVKVFNEVEYCVSYDTETAYSRIAALCGCISIVMPEKGKSGTYYRKKTPRYGIAYGWDSSEIEFAKNTQHKILENMEKCNADSVKYVRKFVDVCESYFCA